MTAMVASGRDALPAVAAPMSPALAEAVRGVLDPHPDVGFQPPTEAVRREAAAALPAAEAALAPATVQQWQAFLQPMVAVVANPPDRAAFAGKAAAIALAMAEVPAAALTPGAQRAVMRSCRWFPTPADLTPVLAPHAIRLRCEARALRKLATARPASSPRMAPTAAEVQAVQRAAASIAAAAGEMTVAVARPCAAALTLSPERLLAEYDRLAAKGGPGADYARLRAEVLRQRLACRA